MSITTYTRDKPRGLFEPFTRSFFESPQAAGRKITVGFTYLQRIGKNATFDVWFPDALKRVIEARIAQSLAIGPEQFPAQWAAVRQFELLQESGNHKIYDLDPQMLQRSILDLSKSMRAGGYRVTVATLGTYCDNHPHDDLEILDRDLQNRIAQMIQMLYLDQQSGEINAGTDAKLAAQKWDYRHELPHVGIVLGAQELFQLLNEKTRKGGKGSAGGLSLAARKNQHARHFFEILNALPQNHIVHDTAVGLQLPELNGRNQWNYIAHPEETLGAFNRVLGDLFDKFNGVSLSRLNGHDNATSEIKASTLHLRGYGDHMNEKSAGLYRNLALALG